MDHKLLTNLANKYSISKVKTRKLEKNIYYINVITNKKKEDNMISIINIIMNNYNNIIIGIDFEFNKVSKTDRDVALMQINIETNIAGYIFILDPKLLSKNNKNKLIDFITKKEIIKVLHGSESLDIPYLFKQFFETLEQIDNFCINLYDTKYYCDYNNLQSNLQNNKCGIYDLLYYYKIIDDTKIKYLDKLNKIIGPLYNIHIDIHKLNDNLLKYCYYDVIYLPSLIKKILLNKNDIYKILIPEISSIIHKYKNDDKNIFNELIDIIGKMNTMVINNKIAIEYFKEYIEKNPLFFHNIDKINYFKKTIYVLIKLFIYNKLFVNKNLSKYINYISKYPYIFNLLNKINIS